MTSSDVDRYLTQAPAEHRPALAELRRIIHTTVPDVDEMIRVGVPAFKVRGRPLASIGSAARHVALYLMYSNVIDDHAELLADLDTSKTVVRFDFATSIPESLVVRLLRARLTELGMTDVANPESDREGT